MSTPEQPVLDPKFKKGDVFDGLTRDATGRWFTDSGLWVLSDHHVASAIETEGQAVKKQSYVAGFLMTEDCRYVVLIRKAKPEWQRGRLNGVGGKIESGDQTSVAAMVREFREETGLTVEADRWQRFATVAGAWGNVKFFRAFGHIEELMQAKTTAPDEGAVGLFWIDQALLAECLPNLSWLLPLAQYRHDRYAPLLVVEAEGGAA